MRFTTLGLLAALLGAASAGAQAQEAPASETPPNVDESTSTEAATPVEPATAETEPASPTDDTQSAEPAAILVVETGVIDDPELGDAASSSPSPGSSLTGAPTPFVPTGDARVVLQTRVGMDTHWGEAREDVFDATQIMLLETRLRRSEHLRFVAGVRARHLIATRQSATETSGALRHALDLAPTAGYADITVDDGVHLRAGYQVTRLGRFDAWSATNFLAVADLRSGAATMPDALDVAQLAARLDWDPNPWLNVQMIHVPFFQPHTVDLVEGDYAMFQTTQDQLNGLGGDPGAPMSTCEPGFDELNAQCVIRTWMRNISRSGNAGLASGTFSAFGPNPSLANSQGALRVTARGASGEIAVTAGTALEHLPMLRVDTHVQNVLSNPDLSDTQRAQELGQATNPLAVEHNRFFVLSTDGAMPIGPTQIGFEAAYMFDRTLYAAQTGCATSEFSECVFYLPVPERTDMLHGALRFEFAQDESLLIGVEGFFAYALNETPRPERQEWLTLRDGRYMTGAAGMFRWSPAEDWTLEFSGAALAGPTWYAMPRIQWRAAQTLYAELGAIVVDGAAIPSAPVNPMPGSTARVDWAVGGMFGGVDQVFAGLKWTP